MNKWGVVVFYLSFLVIFYVVMILNVKMHEQVHVENCKHICGSNATMKVNYLTVSGRTEGCVCSEDDWANLNLADSFNEAIGYNVDSLILSIFVVGIMVCSVFLIILWKQCYYEF